MAEITPKKAVAAIPGCATGFDVGTSRNGAGFFAPAPHLDIHAMFNAGNPGLAGGYAGDSYAFALENHPRYPSMRRARDADLLARLDRAVDQHLKNFALLLPPLGFDEAGVAQYRSAALRAFRSVLPTN